MMRQKDWVLILVITFVGGLLSFFVSRSIFNSPASHQQKAQKVDAISANFPALPTSYFNAKSFNPTQPIQIGDSNNPNPFNGTPQ